MKLFLYFLGNCLSIALTSMGIIDRNWYVAVLAILNLAIIQLLYHKYVKKGK